MNNFYLQLSLMSNVKWHPWSHRKELSYLSFQTSVFVRKTMTKNIKFRMQYLGWNDSSSSSSFHLNSCRQLKPPQFILFLQIFILNKKQSLSKQTNQNQRPRWCEGEFKFCLPNLLFLCKWEKTLWKGIVNAIFFAPWVAISIRFDRSLSA